MKRHLLHFLALAIVSTYFPSVTVGASPIGTAFSYQGQLVRKNGGPVTGNINIRFRLFDGPNPATSSLVGSVEICPVRVDQGLFDVALDFGVVFRGDERYLEVATSSDGSCDSATVWDPLAPLQPMLATPYAQYALAGPPASCPSGHAIRTNNGDGTAVCVPAGGTFNVSPCPANMAINSIAANGTVTCVAAGITSVIGQGGILSQVAGYTVTLTADPTALQRRVHGTCNAGSAISAINEDGSVVCVQLAAPGPVGDTGWFSAPIGKDVSLNLGSASYDFLFGYGRSASPQTGTVIFPIMAASEPAFIPAYHRLSGNTVNILGSDSLAFIQSPYHRDRVLFRSGEVRLLTFQRASDYDSGWRFCASSTSYVFTHNLGVLPTFAIVEVAENDDGTGWRVPMMTSTHESSQTAIVAMDSATVTLRTRGALAYFTATITGAGHVATSPRSGYCRVRLFDWAADFDSGWVPFSTAAGDSDKWFQHGLGATPSLVMLWLSESPGEGGWLLPAMSPPTEDNYGTTIYHISETMAVVKGDEGFLAKFVDANGASRTPERGYLRFLAWR